MSNDSGIRSLYPGIVDEDDIKEQREAKAAVMKRLNVQPSILPAAMDERINSLRELGNIVSFSPSFYKTQATKKEIEDKKFKKMMEDEYGEKALEKDVRAKIFKNKKAGKGEYEDFATHDVIVAENMRDEARKKLKAQSAKTDSLMVKAIRHSSTPVKGYVGGATPVNALQKNKKNFTPKVGPNGMKGQLMVDPKHPDGFRYTDVNDLYKAHGDNPERYIEEVMYMYEDGPVPKAGVIKPYDQFDKSTYPMNQTKSLMKYQNAYNKLTPQQKKVVETNNKKKENG